MKKLAVNSFLAITAMAWLGQPAQAQTSNSQLRESSDGQGLSSVLLELDGNNFDNGASDDLTYSAEHRQLLQAWLKQQPLPNTVTAGLQRDDLLEMFHHAGIAMLPGELSHSGAHASGSALDLHIGEQVVRVMRNSRRVIDCVNV